MAKEPMQLVLEGHRQTVQMLDVAAANLTTAKQDFCALQREVDEINLQQNKCLLLDVGGQPFHVCLDALQPGRSKLLATLASNEFAPEAGDDGYVFIDRDPQWFATVLAYVREDAGILPGCYSRRRAILKEAVYYQVASLEEACPQSPHIVVVPTYEGIPSVMISYDIWRDVWEPLPCPTLAKWEILECCAVGNCLYLVAEDCAIVVREQKRSLLQYDPRSGHSEVISFLPVPFEWCRLVYIEPVVLFCRQFCGQYCIQEFHVDTGESNYPPELQGIRGMRTPCVVNGHLVLRGSGKTFLAYKRDVSTKRWVLVHQGNLPCFNSAFASLHGRLMVTGGEELEDDAMTITGRTQLISIGNGDQIDELPHLNVGRSIAQAVPIDDKMFILSDDTRNTAPELSIEVLSTLPMGGHWTSVTTLPMDSENFTALPLWF